MKKVFYHALGGPDPRARCCAGSGGLAPGDVVAFRGDLGSGKTCMIQGVCEALQVADYVTSPTFILINEYAGRYKGRDLPVYHFDLYRLRGADELEELGAEEYFYGQGVCLVEWAERADGSLPDRCCHVWARARGGLRAENYLARGLGWTKSSSEKLAKGWGFCSG